MRKPHPRRALVPAAALGLAGAVTAALLTTGSGSVAATADATAAAPKGSVTITGSGAAIGAPDVLRVSIAIGYREKSVAEALEKSNKGVRRVRDALLAEGVAARDIQTTNFNVHRTHSKKAGTGYRASQNLAVLLRNLEKAGDVIARAAAAGGNATSINGVSYAIEDREELLRLAREAAFADAKAKAEKYAKLAGRPLGKVRTVKETEGHYGYGYYDEYGGAAGAAVAAKSAGAGGSDVPLAAGTQTVSVRNTVVWDLN